MRDRKPRTPLVFFFFGAFESFDEDASDARLAEVRVLERALESNLGWTGDDVAVELGVDRRWSAAASLDGVSEDEVWAEESDVWSAGRGFLYISLGIRTGRACSPAAAGAMVPVVAKKRR